MNALVKTTSPTTDIVEVLQNSLYPGAKRESVELVLAWCRATGRDPMKKPIHIVPMYVRDAQTGQGGMRDVLMPGIGTYRTDAATTGEYVGKSEPTFGPEVTRKFDGMEVTFPSWCSVTVKRFVQGEERTFTAKEYWVENYATGKEKKGVNDMWRKRPYGQLAKCAESQALRAAFPDETGNTNTAEEMEGKTFEGVTIDAKPEPHPVAADHTSEAFPEEPQPTRPPDPFAILKDRLARCEDYYCVVKQSEMWRKVCEKAEAAGKPLPELMRQAATDMLAERLGDFPAPKTDGPTLEEEFGEGVLG